MGITMLQTDGNQNGEGVTVQDVQLQNKDLREGLGDNDETGKEFGCLHVSRVVWPPRYEHLWLCLYVSLHVCTRAVVEGVGEEVLLLLKGTTWKSLARSVHLSRR
jgi:hypothetical protein